MLGVLGGMGPMATVDFLGKLIQQKTVDTDQQHIPMVVWCDPRVPDRSSYILGEGDNPYPMLYSGIRQLQRMGACAIAIPCNTAHYWYQQLVDTSQMTILHISEAVLEQLNLISIARTKKTVGLLGTSGLLQSGIYQQYLPLQGWDVICPNEQQQAYLMKGIRYAKSGKLLLAKGIFIECIDQLRASGADAVILGCTEIPSVLEPMDGVIDSNLALARYCVRWSESLSASSSSVA
ncbi:amino acid racemase [bacterium]|nr:amino acid racemase [bacterium]